MMEINWPTILTIASIIGTVLLVFKSLKDDLSKKISNLDEKLSRFEKSTEHRLTKLEMETKNTNQRVSDMKAEISQRLSTIEGYLVPRKVFHFEGPHKEEPKEN